MRLQVQNPILPPLFEEAAQQLFSHLIDPAEVGEALREKVAVEGESLEELLQNWITTLLDLVRVQHMVFRQFKIDLKIAEKGPYSLKAEVIGELLDSQRHSLLQNPAALRCEKVQLDRSGEMYHAEIVLSYGF